MGFSALKTPPSCNCYAGKPDRQADMRLKTTPVTSRSDYPVASGHGNILAVSSSESKSVNISLSQHQLVGQTRFSARAGPVCATLWISGHAQIT